jgi:hypothetical protein
MWQSCLAALACNNLISEKTKQISRSGQDDHALVCIYCDSGRPESIDPTIILASILEQLCRQIPNPEIEPVVEQAFDDSGSHAPSRKKIQEAISAVLVRFSQVYIILDGLDECSKVGYPGFENLCKFMISSVSTKDAIVKVMVLVVLATPRLTGLYKDIRSSWWTLGRMRRTLENS